jgi:quercetin dioxygenase-like cupin family protein
MRVLNGAAFDKVNIFGKGQANTAYAQYFIGESYLNPLTVPGQSPVFPANVTFEPGCRNNWHIHHATKGSGQILICTVGSGW